MHPHAREARPPEKASVAGDKSYIEPIRGDYDTG